MTVFANPSEHGSGAVWTLGMLCPRCGGSLDIENQGQPLTREWCAVVRCVNCKARQTLLVRLLEIGFEPGLTTEGRVGVAMCGTDSGYHRHRTLGEKPCQRCREAHAQAEHDRRGK